MPRFVTVTTTTGLGLPFDVDGAIHVSDDLESALIDAEQCLRPGPVRHEPQDRLPVFGDDKFLAAGRDFVQEFEALGLEL